MAGLPTAPRRCSGRPELSSKGIASAKAGMLSSAFAADHRRADVERHAAAAAFVRRRVGLETHLAVAAMAAAAARRHARLARDAPGSAPAALPPAVAVVAEACDSRGRVAVA